MRLVTLKKRADFLRLRDADAKFVCANFVLQASNSGFTESDSVHLGFTATKKLGNAVVRNRTKRRLRAAARDVFPAHAKLGTDYVLIGRRNTVQTPYDALCKDLQKALDYVARRLT